MKQTTTLINLRQLLRKAIPILVFLAFAISNSNAQYVNGNLGTGTVSKSGVTAPAGTQWHEMQGTSNAEANSSIAFDNSPILGSSRVADNFTVPAGVQWGINKMTFYAVVLAPPPATSPITAVRVIIRDASPVGASNIVYGDLTTNRMSSTSFSNIYTIRSSVVPPAPAPDLNFVVWKVEANVSVTLTPGNYWIEWQCVGGAGQRVFALMSQPINARTLPGYNAVSTFNGGPWQPVLDAGNPASLPDLPVDFCFGVDYTPLPCLSPTASVLSQVGGAPVATNLFNETFNTVVPLPAGWAQQNLSNPIGTFPTWFQGIAGVFPANSPPGYIATNFQATTGTNIISNWLFSPNVNLKNGDQFTFYTRTTNGAFPDRLQVRRSTNGASVNAGTTNISVGDFTDLLLDINPTYTATGYPTVWTQYTLTMSGLPPAGISGRIALRYFVEGAGPTGANSDYIGVDDAVYTTFNPAPVTTCTGSIANLKVDITGGNPPYSVVINRVPGGNFTVNNYQSGNNIPVTPAVTTTYSLVSVTGCGVGTGNSGTPTITVLPGVVPAITITDNPTGPLCAGDPKLLTVTAPTSISSFANPASITIPSVGTGTPYPSNITVSGFPVTGESVSQVRIIGLSHTWSNDIDILLQSPTNQNVILMSDVGGTGGLANVTYTFSDAGPLMSLGAVNATGTYHPTEGAPNGDNFPAPGPGPITQLAPALALFGNVNDVNGIWKLFVVDDTGGDQGTINGGWDITFTPAPPPPPPIPPGTTYFWSPAAGLSSTTSNPTAASPMVTTTYTVLATLPGGCQTTTTILITVYQLPAVVTQPVNTTACAGTTVTFTVTATGQAITYQWQESTNGGVTYTNITNGGVYGGATTSTLTLTGITVALNNNRYRCVITGTCPPVANSTGAILTVNALPAVTVTPATICGGVAGTNGVLLTASGASSYTWAPLTGLYTNATATIAYTGTNTATVYAAPAVNTIYTVTGTAAGTGCTKTATVAVNYTPPPPTVNPSSVTMCLGDPAVGLQIISSLQPSPFTTTYTYAGPPIPIVDNTPAGSITPLAVPLPATAQITNMTVAINITHTWDGDLVFVLKAPNGKILNLDYFISGTGGTGTTTGLTNTRFSSTGTAAMSTGTNPYTGIFKADAQLVPIAGFGPTGPTGNLANTALWSDLYTTPNGNWSLGCYDGFGGDFGNITSWSLTFNYLYGAPAAGIWSPNLGLFTDPGATTAYTGTPANQVYTKPAVSTNYSVTVSTPVTPAAFTNGTNFANNNSNFTICFNVRNNNTFPITLTDIESFTANAGAANVQAWYKASAINGPPGAYNTGNGWNQFGSAAITGTTALQTFMSGLTLSIPAGATYGIMIQAATTAGGFDLSYSTIGAGPFTFTQGNVDIITGANIGYGGVAIPGAPTFTPRGFLGNIKYTLNDPSLFACTSGPRIVPVTVNTTAVISSQPVSTAVCTDKVATFKVTASATVGTIGYRWQQSTDNGNTFADLNNGGVYSGVTTNTLTITAPPVTMNGYVYRCNVISAAPCPVVPSLFRVLTVYPLPTIVISPSTAYTSLFPGLTTTLSATVNPAAPATYTWLRNGTAVTGGTNSTLLVDIDGLGEYTLRVTDINGCTNISNKLLIKDSATGTLFIYPNPNSGRFQVRYFSVANNVLPRGLTVYDAKGSRILVQGYTITAPYSRMDVDLRRFGKGVYWIELGDMNGNRLAVGRAVVQ